MHLHIAMMRTVLGIKLCNPLIHNVTTEYMHLIDVATHSVMAICTLKDPILWNTKKVNVVCMYANSLENSSESVLFVQHFMEAIFAPEFVESLKKCATYDKCVAVLAENFQ